MESVGPVESGNYLPLPDYPQPEQAQSFYPNPQQLDVKLALSPLLPACRQHLPRVHNHPDKNPASVGEIYSPACEPNVPVVYAGFYPQLLPRP